MHIRITRTPPGEAPEHIRQAWVGLVLPVHERYAGQQRRLGIGVLTGPRTWLGVLFAMLTGRAQPATGYVVDAKTALELLANHAPEAALWWRTHAPRFLEPGRCFLFAAEGCEEVLERTMDAPLHQQRPSRWQAARPHDVTVASTCVESQSRNGFMREAALVQMAGTPDRRYIPFILQRMGDWVPQVRVQAAKTLERHQTPELRQDFLNAVSSLDPLLRIKRVDLAPVHHAIMQWLVHGTEPEQLLTEIRGLGDASRSRIIRHLLSESAGGETQLRAFLSDRNFLIRLATVRHIVTLPAEWTNDLLGTALNDPFPSVRTCALKELIRRDRATPATLTHALTDPSFDVRNMAAKRLALSREALVEHYREHLKRGIRVVGCLLGLRDTKGTEHASDVIPFTAHSDPSVRQAALVALAGLAPDQAYEHAMSMIVDRNKRIRAKAEGILLERHDQAVFDRALTLLASEQVMHRLAGLSLLNKFGGWSSLPHTLNACLHGAPKVAEQAWVNLNAWVGYARNLFTAATPQDIERAQIALGNVRGGLSDLTYAQRKVLNAVEVFLG